MHLHPHQQERFTVKSGRLGLSTDAGKQVPTAGNELAVPAGTPHTIWNAGHDDVNVVTEHRPALRFEEFLRTIIQLDEAGKTNEKGIPSNPLVAAMVIQEFHDEMQLVSPPVSVQRVIFPLLSSIGQFFGYHLSTSITDRVG